LSEGVGDNWSLASRPYLEATLGIMGDQASGISLVANRSAARPATIPRSLPIPGPHLPVPPTTPLPQCLR